MFKEIIETNRLILRPFELKDIAPSVEMEQNPAINQYTNDGGVKTYDEVAELIKKLINVDYNENGFGRFALELKETGEFIGFCGLKFLRENNEVDLGYRIRMKYWGKGLATEACRASINYGFGSLKLERIVAFVLPENVKSKRILQKLNFEFEEKLMEEGELVYKYGLTKNEFLK